MRLLYLFVIPLLGFEIGSPKWALGAGFDQASFLAFGDLRGHLEPCGCDPATDLGGMRRLVTLVQRERRADPALGSFCTGNIVAPKNEGALKTAFLLEATALVPADACLFNTLEFERALEIRDAKVKPPFVLSNLKNRKDLAAFIKPQLVTGSFLVFGYVSPSAEVRDTEALSPALFKRWKDAMGRVPEKATILLFSGGDDDLAAIERAQIFDAVVSANTSPLDTIVGTQEKDDERRLERKSPQSLVMMVPLGGQGVLRGGKARFAQAKSIGELLRGKSNAAPKPLLADAKLVTWLDASYSDDTPLKDLFERYNKAARSEFADSASRRIKDLAGSPFAGAQACASCHEAAFEKWRASQHAHAMATLTAKGKQEDPECVSCHALGAKEKGGFVSEAASPQFANVQCETCHGPRLEHSKNPTVKSKTAVLPRAVCVSCHNAQHSPAFKQDEYWKKIVHGKSG